MYHEIKPSAGLASLIETFWTFSNSQSPENFKILPDNCFDFIFDFNQNKAFVSGPMTHYQYSEFGIDTDLLGVRFKAENFTYISKIPPIEMTNLRIELSTVIPRFDPIILTQLSDSISFDDKKEFLEIVVAQAANEHHQNHDELISSITDYIRFSKGIINIKETAKSHHISLRQLERRFKQRTGLTIKEFSSVVRFRNAKETISKFKETSLLNIAFDSGFFDHSHMNYEFNRIAGENPSQFR